ncbi:MAG: hypothetical protein KGN16_01095 [Burkholderiales bacterium]|nr:hypothetical protein [Burkholderiales bacterium]
MIAPTLLEASLAADCRPLRQWNILREVALSGRVDVGRLRSALHQAACIHPLSRARRLADRAGGWVWGIADDVPGELLRVVDTATLGTDAVLRELQSERLYPVASPAFRCIVVRGPTADRMLFNFCHERTDGIGAMAFLASVQRSYSGEADPARGVDWIDRRYVGGAILHTRAAWPGLIQHEPIDHLAPEVDRALSSHDTHIVNTTVSDVEALALRRAAQGVTITHQVVAAMSIACDQWNSARGRSPGRICIAVPVNARPDAWAMQGFMGRFGTLFVNTAPGERTDINTASRSVAEQVRHMIPIAKDAADSLARPAPLAIVPTEPAAPIPESFIPTAAVSSLGAWRLPAFGRAGQVLDVWAPPLAQEPMAVALGVLGMRGGVRLSFRFAASMIGGDGGLQFAQMVRELLLVR